MSLKIFYPLLGRYEGDLGENRRRRRLLDLRMDGEEEKRIPAKGWAAMIRKVYEVAQREKAMINFLNPNREKTISYTL
jgi:hypothetical protein